MLIERHPSRYSFAYLAVVTAFMLACVMASHLTIGWQLLLVVAILGWSARACYRDVLLRGDSAVRRLRCEEGIWSIETAGHWQRAELLAFRLIGTSLISLRFRSDRRVRLLMLFADGLDRDSARLLRCRLLAAD